MNGHGVVSSGVCAPESVLNKPEITPPSISNHLRYGTILEALEGSDCLIVVCSDAAAESEWVAREIHHFRRVRPDGACLAIFSPQIHHGTLLPLLLRPTGEQELYIPNPTEECELLAFMRLAAGLLSLPLDQVQRHHAEHRWAQRKSYQEILDDWGKFGQDQHGWYVRALSKALVDYACEHGVSEDQFGDMLTDAIGVVDDLAHGLGGRSSEPSGNFWQVSINRSLSGGKHPPVNRRELDAAVIRYLGLPIRAEEFDRLLVEVLIITELFNLQDFMERPQEARFLPDNERRYYERALKSPWLGVIRDYSVAFLYFGAVIAGVESLAAFGWIGEVARDIMRYVMAAIAIGYGIIAIFSVPRVIRANSVIRSMLDDARVAIEKVIELLRDGAASVADVKKRVAQAEAAEVVWPSSLAPLLNDIAARRLSLWVPPS